MKPKINVVINPNDQRRIFDNFEKDEITIYIHSWDDLPKAIQQLRDRGIIWGKKAR